MTDLNTLLEGPARAQAVNDLVALVDKTTANLSGLTGMAVKSALGAAKKADADAVSKGVDRVLPSILKELNPHWAAYKGDASQNSFGAYLAAHEDEVADSVLKVGDTFADKAPAAVSKVYSSMRGKISGIVAPALPEFGEILEKHAQ